MTPGRDVGEGAIIGGMTREGTRLLRIAAGLGITGSSGTGKEGARIGDSRATGSVLANIASGDGRAIGGTPIDGSPARSLSGATGRAVGASGGCSEARFGICRSEGSDVGIVPRAVSARSGKCANAVGMTGKTEDKPRAGRSTEGKAAEGTPRG